jgi:hypothetical protein
MHGKTAQGRIKARWREASKNLSPGYQALGDRLLSKGALGMRQIDELLSMMEDSGLLLRSLPERETAP